MKWNNKTRYAAVMALCVVLNIVLSELSGNLHLPVWLGPAPRSRRSCSSRPPG